MFLTHSFRVTNVQNQIEPVMILLTLHPPDIFLEQLPPGANILFGAIHFFWQPDFGTSDFLHPILILRLVRGMEKISRPPIFI